MEKAGARPADEINKARKESLGLRLSYVLGGHYYRAEGAVIDGHPVIILFATTDPSFARIGAEESIAAFCADLPHRKLEKEIRFALGIEPSPETYPDYE